MKCRIYDVDCHLDIVPDECRLCPLYSELINHRVKERNKKLEKIVRRMKKGKKPRPEYDLMFHSVGDHTLKGER